jgi:hypothetical protein
MMGPTGVEWCGWIPSRGLPREISHVKGRARHLRRWRNAGRGVRGRTMRCCEIWLQATQSRFAFPACGLSDFWPVPDRERRIAKRGAMRSASLQRAAPLPDWSQSWAMPFPVAADPVWRQSRGHGQINEGGWVISAETGLSCDISHARAWRAGVWLRISSSGSRCHPLAVSGLAGKVRVRGCASLLRAAACQHTLKRQPRPDCSAPPARCPAGLVNWERRDG